MKKIRRDWLKKQIELGKVEAKCDHHLTDDYAFDNANGFGKTDWMPARITRPTFKEITLENGNTISVRDNDDFVFGAINFYDSDFKGKSGGCYYRDEAEKEISFYIHSNAHYTLRIKGN